MSDGDTGEVEQCIRCDDEIDVGDLSNYVTLPYHQERGALPICHDCFDEVESRNLWNR